MQKITAMALLCLMGFVCSCQQTELEDFSLKSEQQTTQTFETPTTNANDNEVNFGPVGEDLSDPVRTGG